MKNLTLIIPAKKEKETLPMVLKELERYNLRTIIVLEKTDLETINEIKHMNCEILYQKNSGYGDALIHGIHNVTSKYFCIFNADGSFLPKELSQMYMRLENENIDFVFGSRYMKNGQSEDDTIVTYIGNKIFTLLGKIFFLLPISDILYTFVIGKTDKAKKLNLLKKDFSFCVELPIKAKKANFKICSNPSYERNRFAGKKKVNAFKDGFLILISMIKIYFKY